jgi:RNA polymerase sigma-70 factor (ECF subfamily)
MKDAQRGALHLERPTDPGLAMRTGPPEGIWELSANLRRRRDVMTGCLDDNSLVRACRAGQTEAFGILVRRYQDRLYPTLLRLVGSAEDAEDVLQDTFVRAFEKIDQFHGESSFYTWAYRIGVNLALSGYRRQRVRAALGNLGSGQRPREEDLPDESPDADPSMPMARAEQERIVADALNQLCPEHRAVVILKDFDGHRYEEISEILKIPVGTVRSRLHRARCELRDRLRVLVDDVPASRPGLTMAHVPH